MLGWSNAEIVVVPWVTGSPPAPTWFYTRGRDSVRIEVRDHGTTFELFVSGPGARKRFVECPDHWAVVESQIVEETHLLALGFTLERFTADQRTERPRRSGRRVKVRESRRPDRTDR
jgi:hypothetical protein